MDKPEIVVLRYGHRIVRDARVTSHCCLVARAFGAQEVMIEGVEDTGLRQSVQDVVNQWGGDFRLRFIPEWREAVKAYKEKGFKVVHLTMYGLPFIAQRKVLEKTGKVLILVGSQKVIREVYEEADYNVSITNQPHSEIGALSVFLYMLRGKGVFEDRFPGAEREVIPSEREKRVKKRKRE